MRKIFIKTSFISVLISGALLILPMELWAGGCFSSLKDGSNLQDACVRWDQSKPVVWRPEGGALKGPPAEADPFADEGGGGGCNLVSDAHAVDVSNAQAIEIIKRSFQRWMDVPNSSLEIEQGPTLDDGGDVNFNNVENFWIGTFITGESSTVDASGCYGKSGDECLNPILFDASGLMTQAIQGRCSHCFILGFAAILPETANDNPQFTITNKTLASSQSVVSGACLDPAVQDPFCPADCCPAGINLDVVEGTMTHELGHYLGLDHTLTNKDEYLRCGGDKEGGCTDQDLENIPTMIGLFTQGQDFRTLHQDDKSTFAKMYPSANFAANTCTIRGYVTTSGGNSGRCLEVVARKSDGTEGEKRSIAVAMPAGEFAPRNTQGAAGVDKDFENCIGDPTVCGAFALQGLPPGQYDLGVHSLANPPQVPFADWAQEPCIPPRAGASILDNPSAKTAVNCPAGGNVDVGQVAAN